MKSNCFNNFIMWTLFLIETHLLIVKDCWTLWWSIVKVEIWIRLLSQCREINFLKIKYFTGLRKWHWQFFTCMRRRSCTGILNHQIFSFLKATSDWVILVSVKFSTTFETLPKQTLAHHITCHPNSTITNHTHTSLIFGHLDAYCMKCATRDDLLRQIIFKLWGWKL